MLVESRHQSSLSIRLLIRSRVTVMLIQITSIKISSCQMPSATAQSFNVIDRGNKGGKKTCLEKCDAGRAVKATPEYDSMLLPRKLQSLEDLLHLVREASVRCRIHLFFFFLDYFCGQAQSSHFRTENTLSPARIRDFSECN